MQAGKGASKKPQAKGASKKMQAKSGAKAAGKSKKAQPKGPAAKAAAKKLAAKGKKAAAKGKKPATRGKKARSVPKTEQHPQPFGLEPRPLPPAPPIDLAPYALPPEKLRKSCDHSLFHFASTDELPSFDGIVGQDRAMDAIRLGLKMHAKGYNIYVAGDPGTGKTTTIKHILGTIERGNGRPPDIVYVNNFKNPDMPRALLLPAGQGAKLREDMKLLVQNVQRNIAQIYESDQYKERMKALIEEFKEREKKVLRAFEESIRKENFALIQVQLGPFSKPEIAPIIAGEPVQMERLEALTHQGKFDETEFTRLREKYEELTNAMEQAFKASRDLKRELRDAMAKLQQEFGSPAVTDHVKDLLGVYAHEGVQAYLGEVQEEILGNMERFIDGGEGEEQKKLTPEEKENRFRDFSVNVLVDNTATPSAPVILETSPNYRNLFGTIDRVIDRSGHWVSDFTRIKAGSLMRASGGTLVINLMDAIGEPGVWIALKRTLKHQKIDIQIFDPFYLYSVSSIKPEPIPLDIKVVVIGDRYAYHILYNYDDDFRKIFKVKAEFDTEMRCTEDNVRKYVNFARKITSEEGLRAMDPEGVGALVEHGLRLGGRQNRLTTRFSEIADVIREAHHWAGQEGAECITAAHVKRAIAEREERLSMIEEKLREMIEEQVILIDTTGEAVGQVNGLSIHDLGDYAFGLPTRITAKCSLGRERIVNIEREADMSGKTHNKGMLILEGYFRSLFAATQPLAVHATICFEQSYGGVDGDSASSAEVYALFSALAGVPLRQDIAVTGSVNQNGQIQPIGGVNEKIEGFFAVCNMRGLTGTQGVLIPSLNVPDLMLREEVVAAVREGRFHIYAAETIPQGMEVLTGRAAGSIGGDGHYPEETVFGLVEDAVAHFADLSREFSQEEGED
ncbi:MAG: AAA family ATPase [Candidatus Eisenbacteria bacterium]|nr:AAA family ATPase [Candidatus Eisenbacteria bacterium]